MQRFFESTFWALCIYLSTIFVFPLIGLSIAGIAEPLIFKIIGGVIAFGPGVWVLSGTRRGGTSQNYPDEGSDGG